MRQLRGQSYLRLRVGAVGVGGRRAAVLKRDRPERPARDRREALLVSRLLKLRPHVELPVLKTRGEQNGFELIFDFGPLLRADHLSKVGRQRLGARVGDGYRGALVFVGALFFLRVGREDEPRVAEHLFGEALAVAQTDSPTERAFDGLLYVRRRRAGNFFRHFLVAPPLLVGVFVGELFSEVGDESLQVILVFVVVPADEVV